MTVPDAPALIRDLASDPSILVGAGTVPDRASAEACLTAGARFLVAPWIDAEVAQAAHAAGACAMLGAMTPTEVRAARLAGADVVKIFPANSAGGPGHIRALRAVFPDVAFCPTGGVDARNAPDYLAAGAAFVGIGGKLVDETLLARGDRAAIEAAARDVLGLMQA
jgi:2-dehydro-3-deoxyphosphogluconate aldolase/(4S)-4-hydroxy-2-oxoglutarate aldolase